MNDIIPPRRPQGLDQPRQATRPTRPQAPLDSRPDVSSNQSSGLPPVQAVSSGSTPPPPQPTGQPGPESNLKPATSKSLPEKPFYRRWWVIPAALAGLALLVLVVAYVWYQQQLTPVAASGQPETVTVEIPAGTTPDQISNILVEKSLIRSPLAFNVYTRLEGVRHKLLAGSYRLSPTESTPEIVQHLTSGRVDEFSVTFYPGASLKYASENDSTPSHRKVLLGLGYSEAEIDEAFSADYSHPLLADKPAGSDIEGYLYGDTYRVAAGSSVKAIIERTFDHFYEDLQSSGVLAQLDERDMTLHQAVILASIVQREVSADAENEAAYQDQRQVAQVFYHRLDKGMPLGADATFIYAANRLGVAPRVELDSPYNTRKNTGLPPGPISSPGIYAMRAVASPAEGDYLYFVSGDDGRNYFSKTLDEHEANTRKYCIENCSLF